MFKNLKEKSLFEMKITPELSSIVMAQTSEDREFMHRVLHESKSSTNPFLRRWKR